MPKLSEVFGIATSVPKYTYVDRARLDQRFKYFVDRDRHLVIHGASKQGKTILWKKNLQGEQCILIQCRTNSNLEEIYLEILRKTGTQIPTEITKTLTFGAEGKSKFSGGLKLPLLASGSGELAGSGSIEKNLETVNEPIGVNHNSLGYIAEEIKKSSKKIIIEDFHYLPDDEKKHFAFDLKAFWDNSVFFIIIGIWAEQNLLTYYNGDLSGRVNEIDVQWTNEELKEVIEKGEKALNIFFPDNLKLEFLSDANQNVGLLQRIAESCCLEAGILEDKQEVVIIDDINALDRCRQFISQEEAVRYRQFCDAVIRGFRNSESSELKVYERITRVCIEASDVELCNGINRETILERINESEPKVRPSDLSAALNKLDKLQADRSISPLVISYNRDSRKVQLVDRELLFYRKYGNPTWPWQETDNGYNTIQLSLSIPEIMGGTGAESPEIS